MRCFLRSRHVLFRSFAIRDQYESLRRPAAAKVKEKPKKPGGGSSSSASVGRDVVLPPPPPSSSHSSLSWGSSSSSSSPFAQPDGGGLVVRAALVGLANAGKSTLLNALVGEALAAVSSKPHTTRRGILGFFSRGNAQAVLVDTPGFVGRQEASRRERELVRAPEEALEECDVALLVVDASNPDEWRLEELAERMKPHAHMLVTVLNKIDAVQEGSELLRAMDRVRALGLGEEPLLVSALKGTHVAELRDELLGRAQPGEWEVGPGQTCEASAQWRVHEAVRQSVFELLHKEIPYFVKQRTVGWLDTPEELQVQQELLLPKRSQARMAIGKGGLVARTMADQAAARLASAFGKPVKLQIHAKYCEKMPETEYD